MTNLHVMRFRIGSRLGYLVVLLSFVGIPAQDSPTISLKPSITVPWQKATPLRPEIPDKLAFYMFFRAVAVNDKSSAIELERSHALLRQIGLKTLSESKLTRIAYQYGQELHAVQLLQQSSSVDPTSLRTREISAFDSLVARCQGELSIEEFAQLMSFIRYKKKNMEISNTRRK